MYYFHNISPYLIQIESLGINIYWYGFSYLVGFLICYNFVKKNIKKNINIDNLFLYCIIGVIFGGRIGEVLFNNLNIMENPLKIFFIWEPGRSFHGAIIGVCLGIWLFSKKQKLNFLYITDLIVQAAPLGIFFGRLANFVNQELVGKISNLPFGVIFPKVDLYPRHPTQIYEALTEGLLLFFVIMIVRKKTDKQGYLTIVFLFCYSFFRFIIEFYKESYDSIGTILKYFNVGHVYCLLGIIISICMYIYLNKRKK
jgi:phosphatidylglycerol:prolipoprotein diacylglycerol transferase